MKNVGNFTKIQHCIYYLICYYSGFGPTDKTDMFNTCESCIMLNWKFKATILLYPLL